LFPPTQRDKMANGDVDAINERLNGLVNLLQVVGIDGVDPDAFVDEQRRNGSSIRGGGGGSMSHNPQSSDVQILELIKKLQLAQADSPEILAALKSPELRALASLAAQKQATQKPPEPKKASPALDDIMDDDDNYPKIGPGYSDDISVVSDMTTPTVMTRQQVAEEEHYREVSGGPGALPPMLAMPGGPAQPARPSMGMTPMQRYGAGGGGGGKTKNMVGQVRPGQATRAIAKSGGAAAQRRLNYQMAMTKLQSGVSTTDPATSSPRKTPKEAFAPASPTPSQQTPMEFPSMAEGSGGKNPKKGKEKFLKKSKKTALAAQEVDDLDFEGTEPIRTPTTSATSGSTGSNGHRKKSPTPVTNDIDWGAGDPGGWQAFDTGNGSNGQDIFVDNHGFFPNDAFGSSDPFAPTHTSSPTPSSKSGVKSPRQRPATNGTRKAVPSKKLSAGRLKKEGDAKRTEKPGKKKSRSRSSLTM
jgi:hypothetical protein